MMLLPYRLHRYTPDASGVIDTWWSKLSDAVIKKDRKELNSMVIIVTRCLCLERNSRVFDKLATMPAEVCPRIRPVEKGKVVWRAREIE
jgi:hypothetical protein